MHRVTLYRWTEGNGDQPSIFMINADSYVIENGDLWLFNGLTKVATFARGNWAHIERM